MLFVPDNQNTQLSQSQLDAVNRFRESMDAKSTALVSNRSRLLKTIKLDASQKINCIALKVYDKGENDSYSQRIMVFVGSLANVVDDKDITKRDKQIDIRVIFTLSKKDKEAGNIPSFVTASQLMNQSTSNTMVVNGKVVQVDQTGTPIIATSGYTEPARLPLPPGVPPYHTVKEFSIITVSLNCEEVKGVSDGDFVSLIGISAKAAKGKKASNYSVFLNADSLQVNQRARMTTAELASCIEVISTQSGLQADVTRFDGSLVRDRINRYYKDASLSISPDSYDANGYSRNYGGHSYHFGKGT